jgi:hypothetical protein
MRLLLIAAIASATLLTVAGLVGLLAFDRAQSPEELLPDLHQLPPAAISVTEGAGVHQLAFLSAVENVGEGPLVVEGRRATRADETMSVEQSVRRSNGSSSSFPVEAELRYVSSETHAHWHFLDFERYELRRAADGKLIAADLKTGFCLGDRFDAEPRKLWTAEPGPPPHTARHLAGLRRRLRANSRGPIHRPRRGAGRPLPPGPQGQSHERPPRGRLLEQLSLGPPRPGLARRRADRHGGGLASGGNRDPRRGVEGISH